MKYLRATFKGYIGFYNGSALEVVDIDFTKCQHNIILIEGKNGSGKSTLLDHLNPFPDGSNSFVPNMNGEKDLTITNGEDVYTIQIYSPADANGSRKTTKAYIQKNGLELNENGNVSSYKDIIFTEFELDSNYISLSRLSSNDRGLGDKKPAERKKFASTIIDNLEVYNNIYKTLNKKSLIYKSHVNTLHTKIQNIGSKDMLMERLNQLKNRETDLNNRIMEANNTIVATQAKNSIDEEEAKLIQSLNESSTSLSNQLDMIGVRIDSFNHKTKIDSKDIVQKYQSDKELLSNYLSKYDSVLTEWKDKSNRLSEVTQNIASLEAELSSSTDNDNISDRYTNSNNTIANIRKELAALGASDNTDMIFNLTNLIAYCEKVVILIDKFNDNMSSEDIETAVNYSKNAIDMMMQEQNAIGEQISKYNEMIADIQSDMKILSVLENRPKGCKIDSCQFISEAISLSKSKDNESLLSQLSEYQAQVLALSDKVTEIQNKIVYVNSMYSKHMELDAIRTLSFENKANYLELFYPYMVDNFDNMIINMNSFNEIRDHKKVSDVLNLLKLLKSELDTNALLEIEYKGFRDKIKLINSSRAILKKQKVEEQELLTSISDLKSQVDNYKSLIDSLNSNIDTELEYSDTVIEYNRVSEEYNSVKIKLDEYGKKSQKAMESLSIINDLRNTIATLSRELEPITKDINAISGSLTLLDSYYAEYNNYKQSYDIIEVLKKYSSPTGGGIQTLFMQLYMSKTKELANQVLAMLFNGAYQLQDFVINDSEFRIPFIGEGLPVDDISSGSSSQIAMMGMVINLVLLHQASTKFNIARLDEIDGGNDSHNRAEFVNVLFYAMNILNIDQLFLISHSIEIDNSFADIIKFKGYDDYESGIQTGNVIYDYNEIIKEQINIG